MQQQLKEIFGEESLTKHPLKISLIYLNCKYKTTNEQKNKLLAQDINFFTKEIEQRTTCSIYDKIINGKSDIEKPINDSIIFIRGLGKKSNYNLLLDKETLVKIKGILLLLPIQIAVKNLADMCKPFNSGSTNKDEILELQVTLSKTFEEEKEKYDQIIKNLEETKNNSMREKINSIQITIDNNARRMETIENLIGQLQGEKQVASSRVTINENAIKALFTNKAWESFKKKHLYLSNDALKERAKIDGIISSRYTNLGLLLAIQDAFKLIEAAPENNNGCIDELLMHSSPVAFGYKYDKTRPNPLKVANFASEVSFEHTEDGLKISHLAPVNL